jgi:squalene-hopene/tetraprenyl-beta-curcumene cyclase
MTYSGFKSYLYAGLARNDPRVTAALDWIVNNYTLEENPGMGTYGLSYYFVVFARAMSAYGAETVPPAATGSKGPRDWRRDLTERLARLQQPDGSFRVVDDRWMESDPVLITAYSLLALESAR